MRKTDRNTALPAVPTVAQPHRARLGRIASECHLMPTPFFSERGHPLFVVLTRRGQLHYFIEGVQLQGISWWAEDPPLRRSGPPRYIPPSKRSPSLVHRFDARSSLTKREEICALTGPLWPRGVHLAPWRPGSGTGRAFVAIDRRHRLVAQSSCKACDDEATVRQLLAMALDIADPPATKAAHA